ncbi:ATP-binding protein [Streptomyces sp. NRRL S-813]|uniref:ATP-binding protein n=1 Tax=Streptomyces sp. NRRL S-813 TaxID=1463919 RepID=UPI00131E418F|nr:sensor histidine kinase [Streptomyces sp. NRRL S-813]
MTSNPEAALAVLGATTVASAVAAATLARSRAVLSRRCTALTQQIAEQNQALATLQARERAQLEELRHLVNSRLPAVALHQISDHHPVPDGLLKDNSDFAAQAQAVLDLFVETLIGERGRIDSAARAALRGACTAIQAQSFRLQTLIDELQRECHDPEVIKEYFRIDQLNEQVLRLVQKAAIVSGSWPGLVRPDTHLPDVVAGATSRLHGFERIQIHSKLLAGGVGVVGRAAEPVAVACAELMANALESSRADLSVEVTLLQTDNGSVCIQIDDAGKGMTREAVARGTRLVSGDYAGELLLTELGDPPALGFAAIGQMVADHGFHVSVDQVSPYGGVRAVLAVPKYLLTTIDETAEPPSAMAALPAPAPRTPVPPAVAVSAEGLRDVSAPSLRDASALPQRRRRNGSSRGRSLTRTARPVDPEEAGAAWGDFEQAVAAGREATDSENKDKS